MWLSSSSTGRGGGGNSRRGNERSQGRGPAAPAGGPPPRPGGAGANANDPARGGDDDDNDDSDRGSDEEASYDYQYYDEEEDVEEDDDNDDEGGGGAGGGNASGVGMDMFSGDAFRGFLMNLSSLGVGEGPASAPIDPGSRGGAGPVPPMAMMDPSGRMFAFGIGNGGGILGGPLGDGGDPSASPRPSTALPVKCPVCNKVTPYASATSAGGGSVTDTRLEERCSHHARTMFVSASCPVCMEDNVGPPMVRWRMCLCAL
jgi:hypothetical protein